MRFLNIAGLGERLAAEMRQRIMVLDGAMGTMIQKYKLSEEHFRGRNKQESGSKARAWELFSVCEVRILCAQLCRNNFITGNLANKK